MNEHKHILILDEYQKRSNASPMRRTGLFLLVSMTTQDPWCNTVKMQRTYPPFIRRKSQIPLHPVTTDSDQRLLLSFDGPALVEEFKHVAFMRLIP